VRYGNSFRGVKAKVAQDHGAVGCIIYSDPEDDGYAQGDVYPKGPWRPVASGQRGSVQFLFHYPGDPLTPGKPAIPGTPRISLEQAYEDIPRIPVQPLAYDEARKLIEPLRQLFKDEAREVGMSLGLEEDFVWRQPFPGPGLAVRLLGEITAPRLALLRRADAVVQDEIRKAGWYRRLWQSFAVLLPVQSVGVMGDERTYEHTIAVRAVESKDGMTADWARLPHDLLARISSRVVNEVKGINRVVYDISSKPPSTIEWE